MTLAVRRALRTASLAAAVAFSVSACGPAPAPPPRPASVAPAPQPLEYPSAMTIDQNDDYHGVTVNDPYRWLEDPDSPESREWIEAQNRLTFAYLDGIPAREGIRKRLEELWDYEKCVFLGYPLSPPIGASFLKELDQRIASVLPALHGRHPGARPDPLEYQESGQSSLLSTEKVR